jgi:hypothetical protein
MTMVSGWRSCDHVGPVHEGDVLLSTVEVEKADRHGDLVLVDLRSRVTADEARPVLDWRFTAILPAGGTVSITRRVGRQRAAFLGLCGTTIEARTALRWGLIDIIR